MSGPGAGVVSEPDHAFGQVPGHDVFERHVLEDGPLVGPQRYPHRLERPGRPDVAEVLRPLAADADERPVDRPDDVGQGDVARGPGQPEASVGATLAADQPGAAQLGEDGFQELPGDALSPGQLVSGDVAATAAGGGELDRGAQGIVGACGQTHVKHYAGKWRLTGDWRTVRRSPGPCPPEAQRPRNRCLAG